MQELGFGIDEALLSDQRFTELVLCDESAPVYRRLFSKDGERDVRRRERSQNKLGRGQ